MIATGMPVQIRRCGTSIMVDRLGIGDLVYDPVCDNYLEIVDILSRATAPLDHRLVRLRAGSLGTGRPSRDLLVSRQQPVGTVAPQGVAGPVRFGFGAARHLGEEVRIPSRLFALFAERPGCICVAGALLQVQDPAALHPAGKAAPPHAPPPMGGAA